MCMHGALRLAVENFKLFAFVGELDPRQNFFSKTAYRFEEKDDLNGCALSREHAFVETCVEP